MKNYNKICQAFLNNGKNKSTEERAGRTPQVRDGPSQEKRWAQNGESQNFSGQGFHLFIQAGMGGQFRWTVSCSITSGCTVPVFPIIQSVKIIHMYA